MENLDEFPLLFDGAFGTYYFAVTKDDAPCEKACITDPEMVVRIHREYLKAGARALTTNTFAANPQTIPDEAQLRALLASGFSLAKKAALGYDDVHIFADIGTISGVSAEQDYQTVTEMFHMVGAENYLFETLSELEPLLPTLEWLVKNQPQAKVFVSFAVTADGYTRKGLYYRSLLEECAQNEIVSAVGLNCLCGPSHMVTLFQQLPALAKPLLAMPNAGYPSTLNGRFYFENNSAYFGEKIVQLYGAGVDILGGCCGTTPHHIVCAADALKKISQREKKISTGNVRVWSVPPEKPAHMLLAVEVDPPLTANCTHLLDTARQFAKEGVDWITVADSPLARARMDSFFAAAKILRETGVRVLPHLSCRDRSAIGIKAALLGAAAENIDGVLIVTGDAPSTGGGVFDFHAASLMRYVSELNADALQANPLRMAGALNVNARNFAMELDRAKKKIQNGASMLLTQPIFDAQALENLSIARKELDCILLAGILPVAGYKNALFLSNEVTGIVIPESLLSQLRESAENAVEISVNFAAEIAQKCFSIADGFYIMTPLGKTEIVCGLLERIRKFEHKGEKS